MLWLLRGRAESSERRNGHHTKAVLWSIRWIVSFHDALTAVYLELNR